jgi:arginine repressor
MAKRRNKAAKIRQMLADRPDASAKEIVEALAAQRTRVSAAQVYNIRSQLGQPKATASAGKYDVLVRAKKLADAMGGVEQARQALSLLAKLM